MPETALFLLVLIPFTGAIFAALMKPAIARTWALVVSFITFALAVVLAVTVTGGTTVVWGDGANPLSLPEIGFQYRLVCDGISIWLVLLTAFVTPLVVISVGNNIDERGSRPLFFSWILLLLGSILGSFIAGDALLFYFFFELTLVPSLLMIGTYGGAERRQAATKFFVYTFAGSVFLLISIIYLSSHAGSFNIEALTRVAQSPDLLSGRERFWISLGLAVGFLIKTPIFPLHTWQPLTYAESPAPAAAMFAGLLSKLGTYGLLRLALPLGFFGMLGSPHHGVTSVIVLLCLVSIIYGGLIAWVQKDIVRLIAYSSMSHLGLCVLAIFASTTLSLQGAVMYMIAHGLATAGLLLIVGMIQSRVGSRDLTLISGLFARMPVLGSLLLFFTLASIGLPLTSGFIGEFLSLQGVMLAFGPAITAVAGVGMILGAVYMLHMVAKICFGPLTLPASAMLPGRPVPATAGVGVSASSVHNTGMTAGATVSSTAATHVTTPGGALNNVAPSSPVHDLVEHAAVGQSKDGGTRAVDRDSGSGDGSDGEGYDISGRELAALLPLALAVLIVGVYPTPILQSIHSAAAGLANPGRPVIANPADSSNDPDSLRSFSQ